MAKVPFRKIGVGCPFVSTGENPETKEKFAKLMLKTDESHAVPYVRTGGVDGLSLAPNHKALQVQLSFECEVLKLCVSEAPE